MGPAADLGDEPAAALAGRRGAGALPVLHRGHLHRPAGRGLGLAALACPRADLDTATADVATTVAANSRGSLAAYKDLYRAAERLTLPAGLAYEAATAYPIDDTEARVAKFR